MEGEEEDNNAKVEEEEAEEEENEGIQRAEEADEEPNASILGLGEECSPKERSHLDGVCSSGHGCSSSSAK